MKPYCCVVRAEPLWRAQALRAASMTTSRSWCESSGARRTQEDKRTKRTPQRRIAIVLAVVMVAHAPKRNAFYPVPSISNNHPVP